MELKFSKVRLVKSPIKAHETDAGIDFFIPDDYPDTEILPGNSALIPLGIQVCLPKHYALVFFNKSGVAARLHLLVGSCVIDEGYQGELILNLNNVSTVPAIVHPGDKIIQGLLIPVPEVTLKQVFLDKLYEDGRSDRGAGGFGSTGN